MLAWLQSRQAPLVPVGMLKYLRDFNSSGRVWASSNSLIGVPLLPSTSVASTMKSALFRSSSSDATPLNHVASMPLLLAKKLLSSATPQDLSSESLPDWAQSPLFAISPAAAFTQSLQTQAATAASTVDTKTALPEADDLLGEVSSILANLSKSTASESASDRIHLILSRFGLSNNIPLLDRLLHTLIMSNETKIALQSSSSSLELISQWCNITLNFYCMAASATPSPASTSSAAIPHLHTAVRWCAAMTSSGLSVTPLTLEPLLVALAHAGDIPTCWTLAQQLLDARASPTPPALTALLTELFRRGEIFAASSDIPFQ